jgi:hypothetical protein
MEAQAQGLATQQTHLLQEIMASIVYSVCTKCKAIEPSA